MPVTAGIIAAPIITGAIGNAQSQSQRQAAIAAQQAALQAFRDINVPTVADQSVQLQQEKQAGIYNPLSQQLYNTGPSAMNNVAVDPRLKEAQLQALQGLQGVAQAGGRTMQDQANQQQILGASNQQEAANRGAIQQSMAMRGMSGSGFDLASQLANQQGSASRASQQQTDINAQAQARALQAMQMGGSLAGQQSGQEFGQQSQVANANDLISRFNSQNQQSNSNSNTQNQNSAQLTNLNNAQNISNANTGLANQQQMYNKGLQQTVFNDQMQKAGGQAGQYNGIAQSDNANAAQTGAMWSGIGQGISQGVAAYGAGQPKKKISDDGSNS